MGRNWWPQPQGSELGFIPRETHLALLREGAESLGLQATLWFRPKLLETPLVGNEPGLGARNPMRQCCGGL